MSEDGGGLTCPSAQPDMQDARIIGVVERTDDDVRIAYLKSDAVVTSELLERVRPLDPTHVFRFAARCESSRCGQFDGQRCTLGFRVAAQLEAVVDSLPSCQIRSTCRWHHEVGAAACLRCPQIVTLVPAEHNVLRRVAQPPSENESQAKTE